jgi:hypothetical protein
MDAEPIPTTTTAAAVPRCRCTGIRRCGLCNPAASPTDSAASPLAAASGEPPLPRREWAYFSLPPTAPVPAEAAEAHAAAPALRPPTRWLCPECGQLVVATESPEQHPRGWVRGCGEHVSATDARVEHRPQAPPAGLHFVPNFVSAAEEAQLIAHLDGTASSSAAPDDDGAASSESSRCRWVPSQSGRSKYEIGPQANFKQRKCKLGPAFETGGFDRALRPLLARAAQVTNQVLHVPGNPPVVDFTAASTLATGEALSAAHAAALAGDFVPVEFSCLDYRPDVASNLDPHVDDEWAWGGRVLGVSLLCDAVMTFVQRTPGISCSTVSMTEVPPRRQWNHHRRLLPRRRRTITLRARLSSERCCRGARCSLWRRARGTSGSMASRPSTSRHGESASPSANSPRGSCSLTPTSSRGPSPPPRWCSLRVRGCRCVSVVGNSSRYSCVR